MGISGIGIGSAGRATCPQLLKATAPSVPSLGHSVPGRLCCSNLMFPTGKQLEGISILQSLLPWVLTFLFHQVGQQPSSRVSQGIHTSTPSATSLLAPTHDPAVWIQHKQSFDKLSTYSAESRHAADNNEVYCVAPSFLFFRKALH